MTELVTARLVLRRWRDDDFEPYARICADPEVMRYLGGKAYDREQSDEQLRTFVQHWTDHGFWLWAVEHRDTASLIGFVGLTTHSWWPGVEVGWRLDRAYWNLGLASEGAAVSLEHGFTDLALDRIISITEPANRASQRVMTKNGLSFEQKTVLPHNGVEVVIYGLDREEWERAGTRTM